MRPNLDELTAEIQVLYLQTGSDIAGAIACSLSSGLRSSDCGDHSL